jgi:hypothetical protein
MEEILARAAQEVLVDLHQQVRQVPSELLAAREASTLLVDLLVTTPHTFYIRSMLVEPLLRRVATVATVAPVVLRGHQEQSQTAPQRPVELELQEVSVVQFLWEVLWEEMELLHFPRVFQIHTQQQV